jgi:multiple sugar transport system permease protein
MKLLSKEKEKNLTIFLLLLPACLILLVFTILPSISALILSFTKWDMMSPLKFVGIANYEKILKDKNFLDTLINTGKYVIGFVPLNVLFSLLIALLLNEKWLKGKDFFRVVYYIPVIVSSVVVSMIWKWIYNPSYGLLNQFLKFFGIARQFWIEDARLAIPSLIIMTIWQTFGYNVVLFISGLLSIPDLYYEAAAVDGANKIQQLFNITLPLLAPTTLFVVVTTVITSFQVFDQVLVLGGASGPPKSLMVSVYYLYKIGFGSFKMGYASTIGLVLFMAMLVITIVQFKVYASRFEI